MTDMDMTPRYVPDALIVVNSESGGPMGWVSPVVGTTFYPANVERPGPIVSTMGAIEVRTAHGSRWFGCERAYINSELRMVIIGTNPRDEVRMKWEIVPEEMR